MTTWLNGATKSFAAMLAGGAAVGALVLAPEIGGRAEARPITVQAPEGAPLSFADLIEQVSPAVVSVNVVSERPDDLANFDQFMERFRGLPGFEDFERDREERQPREARSLGSGFFISEDGLVVTNFHVVAGATEIEIVLDNGDEYAAEIVGSDRQTDLAVLKVSDSGRFPYVEFSGDDDVRVGDWVVAVGNPFGLGGTATAGIISADERQIGGSDNPYTDFLQIDAPINRGNSGGPTFDLNGRVIGVNTAIFSPSGGSVGIGFAIPAGLATEVTKQLAENGKVVRGWLGVSIQDVTEEMAEALDLVSDKGAIVADLTGADSPARKSGIKRGDVIVEINGARVQDSTDATRKVGALLANTENEFVVLRDGKRQTINVTVGVRPENPNAVPASAPSNRNDDDGFEGAAFELGVELSALDDDVRRRLDLGEDEPAVLVTSLQDDSPLAEANIPVQPGMAILEVAGEAIGSGEDFNKAIEAARRANENTLLLAVRAGQRTFYTTIDISAEG
ncbi:MAG: Do family serine endopeptidase [Pseudomonadota bacterium]